MSTVSHPIIDCRRMLGLADTAVASVSFTGYTAADSGKTANADVIGIIGTMDSEVSPLKDR